MNNRKPRAVFAVTSRGNDFYSAMTRVAIASLRVSNPQAHVIVTCDKESDEAMRGANDPLIGETDDWIAFQTPAGNDGFRNRHVKTRLRSLLTGPFLFLDSDIFVRGSLEEIFALDCDVAGARNHSREIFAEQVWEQDRAALESMGWTTSDEIYVNGGVLYFNDTAAAHQLGTEWHQRWLEFAERQHSYRDQPALNSALNASKLAFSALPDRFNAQLQETPTVALDATIWHYYASADRRAVTTYDKLVDMALGGAPLDAGLIQGTAESRHPWVSDGLIRVWQEAEALRTEISRLQQVLAHEKFQQQRLRDELDQTRGDLEKTQASKSWRLTRPLRALDQFRKKLGGN